MGNSDSFLLWFQISEISDQCLLQSLVEKPVAPVDDPIKTGRKSGANTRYKLADGYFMNGEVLMAVITTRSALASTIYPRESNLRYVN